MKNKVGFTLIEVLIALAIIAIALGALLKASAQNVNHAEYLKNKMIRHWVAMQAVTNIQLGLISLEGQQEVTKVTKFLDQRWYWRAKIIPTPVKSMQEIKISLSQHQDGPFIDPLFAFRYTP